VACDGHHRCAALACEGPRLVGLRDVLDVNASDHESPHARSLELLSRSDPFVLITEAGGISDSSLVIFGTTI
jgi:hypothetical protein